MADERPTFVPDEADGIADEPIELPEHLQAEQPLPPRPEPEPEPEPEVGDDDEASADGSDHAPGSFLAGLAGGARRAGGARATSASSDASVGQEPESVEGGVAAGDSDESDPVAVQATKTTARTEPAARKVSALDDDAKLAVLLRGAIVAGVLGAIAALLAITVLPEQLRISCLLLAAILAGVAVSMGHVGHRAETLGQAPQPQLSRASTIAGYAGMGVVVVAVLIMVVPILMGPRAQGELRTAQEVAVGDCVADPYATWDDFGEEIGENDWWFDVVPCTGKHFGEISLVNLAPGYGQPTYAEGDSDSLTECIAGFESYVGAAWQASSLTVEDYYPTGPLWDSSPYVVCVVSGVEPLTGTVAGSGL